MGKITDALKKAAEERAERLKREPQQLQPATVESKDQEADVNKEKLVSKITESVIPQVEKPIDNVSTLSQAQNGSFPTNPFLINKLPPDSPVIEQYRQLSNNLFSLNSRAAVRTLVLTSANYGEGKTITSINMGISIARDLGKPVVLVDFNLRNPKVAEFLGISAEKNLLDFLEGNIPLEKVIYKTSFNNLFVVPLMGVSANVTQVLGSQKCKDMIKELKSQFGFVIFDTPPVIPATDAGLIGAEVDGVLIVVQANKTKREVVLRARALLQEAHANVLGFVLSGVEYPVPQFIYRHL